MSKLLSKLASDNANRLANSVRNALVRGLFLIAAVFLLTTEDADAQVEYSGFWIAVNRVTFTEGENLVATDPDFDVYLYNNEPSGRDHRTCRITLIEATLGPDHPNPATLGEDFTSLPSIPLIGDCNNFGNSPPQLDFTLPDDNVYEGNETFILRVEVLTVGTTAVVATETITMTIQDNDPEPQSAEIGGGKHAVARAEALVDNQPRLIPMLRNPGAKASEFLLRASDGGVDASGGFQAETIWGATSVSRTNDGFGDHKHLLATLGAHFRMSERLHLGGMLQFDRSGSEPDGTGESGEINGNGWMVGPYFALREGSQPLYFEGRLLYGRSSNEAKNLAITGGTGGPVNAEFDSVRWLVQGRVEGTYQLGNGMTLIPLADFSHVRDEMESFRDGSRTGEGRTIAISKLQLGAEFEIPVDTAKGDLMLKPGLRLVVSDVDNTAGSANSGEPAEARGRLDFGLDYRLEDNIVLGFDSFYSTRSDREEFSSYGAGLNLQFEF